MSEAHMESRIQRLETNVDNLSTAVGSMSQKMEKVVDSISVLKTAIETNKPISYTSIVTTAISTAILVSMCVSAIWFLVDTRVGAATTRSNVFVSEMTDKGNLYVQMDRLSTRIERMESAIRWHPTLVSAEEIVTRKK